MIKSKVKSQKSKVGEQGITIYLAMLMLSAALATALFVSTVFAREFKISKEVTDSLKAVYAADTAMEYTLYQARVDTTFPSFFVVTAGSYLDLPTGSCEPSVFSTNPANKKCSIDAYLHVVPGTIPDCPVASTVDCTHIITKGSSGGINRAIEITYENK